MDGFVAIPHALSSHEGLKRLSAILAGSGGSTSAGIGHRFGRAFGLVDPAGKARGTGCLAALRRLERDGKIELPAPRCGGGRGRVARLKEAVSAPEGLAAISALRCGLRHVGSVSLELVVQGDDRRRWDAMMEAWHPLGWNRAPGGQVRYWIRSSVHAVLGGVGFSAASWHRKARDEWIGWSADARAAHLERVLCNHRFLLLPRIHGLNSRVLQMATERIAGDWSAAYAARPVLA